MPLYGKRYSIVLVNFRSRRITAICLGLIRTNVDLAEAVLAGMRRATPSQKGGADSAEVSWLQPGEGWRAALTDGRLIALLFALADKPVGRDGPTGGALEGTPVLSALTSLSSLEGAVFENRTARGAFYNSMLSQSLGRLEQAIAATESGALAVSLLPRAPMPLVRVARTSSARGPMSRAKSSAVK